MGNGEARGSLVFAKTTAAPPYPLSPSSGVGPSRLSPSPVASLSLLPAPHLTLTSSDCTEPTQALKLGKAPQTHLLPPSSTSHLIPISCLNKIQKKQVQLVPGRMNSPRGRGQGWGLGVGQAEEPQPGVMGPTVLSLSLSSPSQRLAWQRPAVQRRLAETPPRLPLRHHVTGAPGRGQQPGQKSSN